MGIKRNRVQSFGQGNKMGTEKRKWIHMVASELQRHGISPEKAKFILAQVVQESGWDRGLDEISERGNNVFNVVKGSWTGETHVRGDHNAKGEKDQKEFRSYSSIADAVKDYLHVLKGSFPEAYQNITSEEGSLEGFLSGLKNGVYGSFAEAMNHENEDGSIQDMYSPKIRELVTDSFSDVEFQDVESDRQFTDDDNRGEFYNTDSNLIDFEQPKYTDALSPEEREKLLAENMDNLIEKDGKYYEKTMAKRKVDSKRIGEDEFKNATGTFNLTDAILKAQEEGRDDLVKELVDIKDKMGDTTVSIEKNDRGGVDWRWEGEDKIGHNLLGKRKKDYQEAMQYVVDNDLINYNQVDEYYSDADLEKEWRDSKGHTAEENKSILAENGRLKSEYEQRLAQSREAEQQIEKDRQVHEEKVQAEADAQATADATGGGANKIEGIGEGEGDITETPKTIAEMITGDLPAEGDLYKYNDNVYLYDKESKKLYWSNPTTGIHDRWNRSYDKEFLNKLNAFNKDGMSAADKYKLPKESYRDKSVTSDQLLTDQRYWYLPDENKEANKYYRNPKTGEYIAEDSEGFYRKWDAFHKGWGDDYLTDENPLEGYKEFDYKDLAETIQANQLNFANLEAPIDESKAKNIMYRKFGAGNNRVMAMAQVPVGDGMYEPMYWRATENGWMRTGGSENFLWGDQTSLEDLRSLAPEPLPDELPQENMAGMQGGLDDPNAYAQYEKGGDVKIPKAAYGINTALMNTARKIYNNSDDVRNNVQNATQDAVDLASSIQTDEQEQSIGDYAFSNYQKAQQDAGFKAAHDQFRNSKTYNVNSEKDFYSGFTEYMAKKPWWENAEKYAAKYQYSGETGENTQGENKVQTAAKNVMDGIDLSAIAKFAFSKPVRADVVKREVARPGQVNTIAPNTGMTTEEQRIAEQNLANQIGKGTSSNPNDINAVVQKSKAIAEFNSRIQNGNANRKMQSEQMYNRQMNQINERDARYDQMVKNNKFQNEAAQAQADLQYDTLDQQRKGQLVADTLATTAKNRMAEDMISNQQMGLEKQQILAPYIKNYQDAYNELSTIDPTDPEYATVEAKVKAAEEALRQKDAELFKDQVQQRTDSAKGYYNPTTIGNIFRKHASGGSVTKEMIKQKEKTKRAKISAEEKEKKRIQKASEEAVKLFLKKEKEVKKENKEMLKDYFTRK